MKTESFIGKTFSEIVDFSITSTQLPTNVDDDREMRLHAILGTRRRDPKVKVKK